MSWLEDRLWSEEDTIELFKKYQIKRAVVAFSGGNDEGGADSYRLFLENSLLDSGIDHWPTFKEVHNPTLYDDESYRSGIPRPPEHLVGTVVDANGNKQDKPYNMQSKIVCIQEHWHAKSIHPKDKGMIEEHELAQCLSSPMYNEYYSFAGNFYVYGDYIFTLKNDKLKVHQGGTLEQSCDEPIHEDYTYPITEEA